jgi:arsenate reductase
VGLERGAEQAIKTGAKFGADSGEQFGFHQRAASLARNRAGCQASALLTVYCYQKYSTCRDSLKWLNGRSLAYQVKAIRETPPSHAELATALKAAGGDLRKIFNTSGMDYRALGLKDQLPAMSESAAFELLSRNGNLVKRPFLIGYGKVLVGFKEPQWEKALG